MGERTIITMVAGRQQNGHDVYAPVNGQVPAGVIPTMTGAYNRERGVYTQCLFAYTAR
jgi:hypothetical protein